MRNNRVNSPDPTEVRPSTGPEIDYSPKTFTLRDQIVFGVKLFVVAGILLLMLWLVEKYLI
jgi:hypothetical protein